VKHGVYRTAIEGLAHVQLPELEAGIVAQMIQIRQAAGEQIVHRNHRTPVAQQTVAEV
jgi:hypothetical protein